MKQRLHVPGVLGSAVVGCLLAMACSAAAPDDEAGAPDCASPCSIEGRCEDSGECVCDGQDCAIGDLPVGMSSCCVATTVSECQASSECALQGRCSLGVGSCYAGSDYECATSNICETVGRCYACDDGTCGDEASCG
jgi:hypothetical protein